MRSSLVLILSLCVIGVVAQFQNNPPVPGRHPGKTFGGDASGVEVEIFYDLLCSASAQVHPELLKFLAMPFMNSTVAETVKFTISFVPLPYHHNTWIVSKLVPYIVDHDLQNPSSNLFLQYVDFCFQRSDWVLGAIESSYNDFVKYWGYATWQQFNLDKDQILGVYNATTDTHNSEMRTREMWKYAAAKGVSGTPTSYVNGVLLNDFPQTAQDWMDVLDATYNSQYHGKMTLKEEISSLESFLN